MTQLARSSAVLAVAFAALSLLTTSASAKPVSETFVGMDVENGRPMPFNLTISDDPQASGVLRFGGTRGCSLKMMLGKVRDGLREYKLSPLEPGGFCQRLAFASVENRTGEKVRVTVRAADASLVASAEVSTPAELKDDPAAKALLGSWLGVVKGEGDCVLLKMGVRNTQPGTVETAFTYGRPRTCAAKAEYAGFVKGKHYFNFVGLAGGDYCKQFVGTHAVAQPQADGTLTYDIVAAKGQVIRSGTLEPNRP